LELQQRSIEFATIFSRHEDLLAAIFERMPPMEKASKDDGEGEQSGSDDNDEDDGGEGPKRDHTDRLEIGSQELLGDSLSGIGGGIIDGGLIAELM
jgi:hypothetical protein